MTREGALTPAARKELESHYRQAVREAGVVHAAAYLRVSDPKQDAEGTSLETQEAAVRARVAAELARLGWRLGRLDLYREVHSGRKLANRKVLTKLRAEIKAKRVDLLIFFCLDRLARNPVDQLVVLMDAAEMGCHSVSVKEELELTEVGKFMIYAYGFAAGLESTKIGERTTRGRRYWLEDEQTYLGTGGSSYGLEALKAPKANGREVTYGVRQVPAEADVVRRIFAAALRHSDARIAADLTREEIPSPSGGTRWAPQGIRRILRNEVYTGIYVNGTGEDEIRLRVLWPDGKDPHRLRCARPADPLRTPLITREAWEAVRAARSERRWLVRAGHGDEADDPYDLRGLVRCGACGSACSKHQQRDTRYYRCSLTDPGMAAGRGRPHCTARKFYATDLEAVARERVEGMLANPAEAGAAFTQLYSLEGRAALSRDRERVLGEVARHEAALERLEARAAYAEEEEDRLAAVRAGAGVREALRAARARAAELRQQIGPHPEAGADRRAWVVERLGLLGRTASLVSREERRAMYAQLRLQVRVFPAQPNDSGAVKLGRRHWFRVEVLPREVLGDDGEALDSEGAEPADVGRDDQGLLMDAPSAPTAPRPPVLALLHPLAGGVGLATPLPRVTRHHPSV